MTFGSLAADRRADPRLPLSLAAHCQVGMEYFKGLLVDVSRSGLGLSTERRCEPGTALRVALALPHADGPKFCTLAGTVVRTHAGGIGVKLDPEQSARGDQETLQGFLALMLMRRAGPF